MISAEVEGDFTLQDLRDALQCTCDAGAEFQFQILTTQAPSFIVLFWRDASEDAPYLGKRMSEHNENALAIAAFQQLADELEELGVALVAELVQRLRAGNAKLIDFNSLDDVKIMATSNDHLG
jgi:hypothetical protein